MGQKKAQINFTGIQQKDALNFSYSDTLQLAERLQKEVNLLHSEGYLLARVSNVKYDSAIMLAEIYAGGQFKWLRLSPGNLPQLFHSKIGYKPRAYIEEPFKPRRFGKLITNILTFSQNSGYPFASLQLDSIEIQSNNVAASLKYTSGPFIAFDSLHVSGDAEIKQTWLQAYLGIIPLQPFNQEVVSRIETKIKNLPFVKLVELPRVTFQNEVATVHLNLQKVRSNQIDGIIGFLPNEKSDGSTLVTGQFDMELNNLFNSGKSIDVHWQSLKPESQLLDLAYRHPNILHSPLHMEASFYLLKEDSTFINRRGRFEFQYAPSSHQLSFFTRLESSRLLLSNDQQSSTIEEITDFNITYYGLSYRFENISSTRVPRGIISYVETAVGNKTLRNLDELQQQGLNKKSTQYLFHVNAQWLNPISKSLGLAFKFNGGKLINDQLFLNDLFRIGGIESLRGFNESFYFAEEYAVGTAELRYHYDDASYLFLFADQSYIYYNLRLNKFEDYPLGLGAGLSLQTKRGRLNLVYALGKSDEQPLSFSLSKFHFGYVANF